MRSNSVHRVPFSDFADCSVFSAFSDPSKGHLMDTDAIIQRWRQNAATAGVRLTEEDIERIVSRGMLERIVKVEDILERMRAENVAPDYLQVLSVYTGDERHG